MKDSKLTLLQYNVQKSQSVQELLLATSALQEVDIIALQEPWKNPHLETSTSTVFSSFLPLYFIFYLILTLVVALQPCRSSS